MCDTSNDATNILFLILDIAKKESILVKIVCGKLEGGLNNLPLFT
jgi:hypothetical protein